MGKFYFTYGTEGHPFYGGWTVVTAPDMNSAIAVFKMVHPCKHGDTVNCAGIYTEEFFNTRPMSQKGNFGAFAVEEISLSRTILDESRMNG